MQTGKLWATQRLQTRPAYFPRTHVPPTRKRDRNWWGSIYVYLCLLSACVWALYTHVHASFFHTPMLYWAMNWGQGRGVLLPLPTSPKSEGSGSMTTANADGGFCQRHLSLTSSIIGCHNNTHDSNTRGFPLPQALPPSSLPSTQPKFNIRVPQKQAGNPRFEMAWSGSEGQRRKRLFNSLPLPLSTRDSPRALESLGPQVHGTPTSEGNCPKWKTESLSLSPRS